MTAPPLLIEPEYLDDSLSYDNVLLIDLSKPGTYSKLHVPGAVHLDFSQLVSTNKPVMGQLPDDTTLERVLSATGISNDTHVIAYDDEGGGRACRLLWTLAAVGHNRFSLLNGGLHAWANEGHRWTAEPVTPVVREFKATHDSSVIARPEYILEHLDDDDHHLLDVRSPQEFSGAKKLAERGGHIPGAVNVEWTQTMDRTRNLRLLPDEQLRTMYGEAGITPEHETICYCQTHHRSAHAWFVLKYLGHERVRGFPGSWSLWGNREDLPVET